MVRILLLGIMLFLSACDSGSKKTYGDRNPGAGGGGHQPNRGAPSIKADKELISIIVDEGVGGAGLVKVDYKGDDIIFGTVEETPWLKVEVVNATQTTGLFSINTSAVVLPGTYSAAVRFLAFWYDSEEYDFVDVIMSLTVLPPILQESEVRFLGYTEGDLPEVQILTLPEERDIESVSYSVEYLRGQDWLSIEKDETGLRIQPTSSELEPAQYQAKILFKDKHKSEKELSVIYNLRNPFASVNQNVTFSTVAGSALPKIHSITLPSAVSSERLTTNVVYTDASDESETWLDVSVTAEGFQIQPTTTLLPLAAQKAQVEFKSGDIVLQTLQVNYSLLSPTLQVNDVKRILAKDDFSEEDISFVAQLATDGAMVEWSIVEASQALNVEAGENSVLVSLRPEGLVDYENGSYTETFTLASKDWFTQEERILQVDVPLTVTLPAIDAVGPYVVFEGQDNSVILHGAYFNESRDNIVMLNEALLETEWINESLVKLRLPENVEAGEYIIKPTNDFDVDRRGVRLVVQKPADYTPATLTFDGLYHKMTLDPERHAVFMTTYFGAGLIRARMNAQSEWESERHNIPYSVSAELSLDGKELYVGIGEHDRDGRVVRLDAETLDDRGNYFVNNNYYHSYDIVKVLLNGSMAVKQSSHYSAYWYPGLSELNDEGSFAYNGEISRDRTRMINNGVSYDIRDGKFVRRHLQESIFGLPAYAMSQHADRIAMESGIYNENYDLLGTLEIQGQFAGVVLNPNGKEAYVATYVDNEPNMHTHYKFYRYDISADTGPYIAKEDPLMLEDWGGYDTVVDIKVSDDGNALYVLQLKQQHGFEDRTILNVLPLHENR